MSGLLTALLLAGCAALEAGGDALIRVGLHTTGSLALRLVWIGLGALALLAYGPAVNMPPWDFGRLLGVYVCLFFLVAQVINRVIFGVAPSPPIMVGGALILAGGLVMTLWSPPGP